MLDLLEDPDNQRLAVLLKLLCLEAGVCIHDPETNPVCISAAKCSIEHGLIVVDEDQRQFRLRVTAQELKSAPVYMKQR